MGAIDDYIKNKIDQGFSSEVIRRELLNDYPKAEVNKAFASYKDAPDYTWAWAIIGIVVVIFVAALLIKLTPSGDSLVADTPPTVTQNEVEPLPLEVGVVPNCDEYCGKIMGVCADHPQYPDERACLLQCEDHLTNAGTLEDYGDNTLGCRLVHTANAERSNPEVHCYHAGLFGGNICGEWCENYCSLSASVCTGEDTLYGSSGECMDSCRSLSKNSNLGDSSGDTVQCRMEQLRLAIDDSSFCSGAAPESAVCIAEPEPSCDEYCGRVVDVCGTTGEDAQYESERACLDFCSAEDIPIGSREDTTGNSLGCRLSHLIIAETVDTVIHCPHAGKTGADVCSDRISLEPLSTATDTEEVTIRIADMAFTPLSVEISVGTKVTWINDDTLPHRVTDRYGYIRSPTLYQTETFSKTFTEVGTYEINCAIHPSMQHTIVVAGEQLAPARNLFDVIRDIFT